MLGKTFKGLTDEMLAWQTAQLLELETSRDSYTVYVEPTLVAEIAFNDVQESPRYPGGFALRLARVKSYRPDKTPADADTFDRVRAIWEAQVARESVDGVERRLTSAPPSASRERRDHRQGNAGEDDDAGDHEARVEGLAEEHDASRRRDHRDRDLEHGRGAGGAERRAARGTRPRSRAPVAIAPDANASSDAARRCMGCRSTSSAAAAIAIGVASRNARALEATGSRAAAAAQGVEAPGDAGHDHRQRARVGGGASTRGATRMHEARESERHPDTTRRRGPLTQPGARHDQGRLHRGEEDQGAGAGRDARVGPGERMA